MTNIEAIKHLDNLIGEADSQEPTNGTVELVLTPPEVQALKTAVESLRLIGDEIEKITGISTLNGFPNDGTANDVDDYSVSRDPTPYKCFDKKARKDDEQM